jgi:Spy/CpxP family protein refolding chaperone
MNVPGPWIARLRLGAGVTVAVMVLSRPAPLESLRWWHSPKLAASIGLTDTQVLAIDRLYKDRLLTRGRCIERLLTARNEVDRLIREGTYDEDTMQQTQAAIQAAADEREETRLLSDAVASILLPDQRKVLARLRPGRLIE